MEQIKLITKEVKIGQLKPAKYNPRQISELELGKLMQSIMRFGFVEPIVINKDNTIIGGHQRIEAAKRLGYKTVPAVYVDLSKKHDG